MTTKKLLILPGDGIGPEIMPQVRRVAQWFVDRGLPATIDEELYGIASWKAYGTLMRDETWEKIVGADAILFGATGSPEYDKVPAEQKKQDWLLKIRHALDLFNNLRPIRLFSGMEDASTLKPEVLKGTDLILVRELTGGLYFGEPRGIDADAEMPRAFNTLSYTKAQVERIARSAFELARTRQGRVCNVDKSNVLEVFVFWRDVVTELHRREYSDVELTHLYVDNCAMQLVRRPSQFDVLVMENLFGDILSDCAAMVSGSLGMLASASMGPVGADGRFAALYEPIHGSAPDIAGQGIANPCGAILSFAMCLRYTFGLPAEADRLERAVDATVGAGIRTRDIAAPGGATVTTDAMGAAVIAALDAAA